MKRIFILLAALAAGMASMPASAADIGIVFLHPKWGLSGPKSPVGPLIQALGNAGFLVDAPEMPWSRNRAYDRDVDGALAEVDAAVKRLKDKGAKRIVVGGQSMGANVALAYAARRDGLAGVMAIAPGHTPEQEGFRKALTADYERARKMLADGKGDVKDNFMDSNQGRTEKKPASARAYVSWLDPNGAAVIPKNTAMLKPGVPLLWVVGDDDPMSKRGQGYAYAKAPAHPKNAYTTVKGGHVDTSRIASGEIIAWLKGL